MDETIQVAVDFFGIWRDLVGERSLTVTVPIGCTVSELVARLTDTHGSEFRSWLINEKTGELWSTFTLSVNGLLIERSAELGRRLENGDRVAFLHPVAGGSEC